MTTRELKQRINATKVLQTSYWDTIEEAVDLAARQVTSKRISELEKPKDVSMREIIVDILFAVAFGPAAGVVIGKLFNAMIRPVLRTRSVLFTLSRTHSLELQSITPDGIHRARRIFRESRPLHLTQTSDDRKLLREAATKLTTSAAGVGLDQAKQALKAVPPPPVRQASRGGDTPDVVIGTFVSNVAIEQRAAIELTHKELELSLDDAPPSGELLAPMEGLLSDNLQDHAGLPELRDVLELYKRFFEAAIWVSLFDVDKLRRPRWVRPNPRLTAATHHGPLLAGYTWTAPESLVEYWYARFPHDGFGSGMSFNDLAERVEKRRKSLSYFPRSYVDQVHPSVDKPNKLITYFKAIEQALLSGARDFGVYDALVQ